MSTDLKEKPTPGYDSDEELSNKQINAKREAAFEQLKKLEESVGITNNLGDHPSLTELAKKTDEIKQIKTAEMDQKNASDIGFYRDNQQESSSTFKRAARVVGTRRRQVAVSGIVVTIFSFIAALISFGSGPAQAIYLSDTMQQAHFFEMEDMGARRTIKLMLNIGHIATGNTHKLRLGVLGNIYADKLTKTMEASGFKENFTDRTSRSLGYTFDTSTISEDSKLRELKGASPETAQNYLKEKFDIDGRIEGGKLIVDLDGSNNRATKRAIKGVLRASGYANAVPAGRARLLATRGGSYSMWHPMAKIDEAFIAKADSKYLAWKEAVKDRIQNGSEKPDANLKTSESAADANGERAPPSDVETQAVEEGNDLLKSGEGISGKISKINTGVAAVGAICAVKAISNNIDDIRQNNVIIPMIRLSVEMISVGDQIRAGKDVDLDQLGYYAKQYVDAKGKSWVTSRSVQYEMGQKLTGKDLPEELQISTDRNPVSNFLNSMDAIGLGTVCDAAGSPLGTIASTFFDVLGGPVSAAAGFAFSSFVLPNVISGVESWIAGDQVNLDKLAGPDLGSAVNYGSRLAANESFAAAGGTPLSSSEELSLRQERLTEQNEIFQRKPILARLFDKTDSSSLLARAAIASPTQLTGFASLAANKLSSPLQSFGNIFSAITVPKAAALESYDYGFPKIGYTNAQIDDPALGDPYENADRVEALLGGSKGSDYIDRMKTCFNIDIDTDGNVKSEAKTVSYVNFADHPECSEKDEDWLRVRMYAFDTQLLESAACFDGVEDQSCKNVGLDVDSDSVGTSGTPSTDVVAEKVDPSRLGYSSENLSCAAGTIDLGVVNSKYVGSLKKEPGTLRTRLCRVPDIPGEGNDTTGKETSGGIVVDAYVSGAWAALGKQAKADGVRLSANSSFRLADSCGGTGDGGACARPGTSMHQTGWAVDFANMSLKGSNSSSCTARARLPNNPGWAWMEKNAEKYGIKQYTLEAWHWDPAPMANRCGTGQ